MARARLTKTGRLRRAAKKRKLKESEPGAIVVLNQARLKKTVGGKRRSFRGRSLLEIGINLGKDDELMFDGDIRKLVRKVQLYLADHYSSSLVAGVTADTGAPLPKIAPSTRAISGSRTGGFGMRTGNLARHWKLGRISGGPSRAKARVWPSDDDITRNLIGKWLQRSPPVDLQSVDGAAADAIRQAVSDWQEEAIGSFVRTPSSADTSEGKLGDKV